MPDLMPANESAIIVQAPAEAAAATSGPAAPDPLATLLPRMTLEIRAAVDATLQKEIASLRHYIGGTLDKHAERVQGDLSTLLPAPRNPGLDTPTMIPERRIGATVGWMLALLGIAGAGFMSWMWWDRGGEIAALNTDLTAAYAELETLRARPVVTAPVETAPADPSALATEGVVPAADAPDAAAISAADVVLVPNGAAVVPPAPSAPVNAAPANAASANAAPASASPASAAPPAAALGAAAPASAAAVSSGAASAASATVTVPTERAPIHNPAQ
jgi:hypothetical protein